MAESRLNACFGDISRATQTFAVRTAVLADDIVSKLGVWTFDINGELQFLFILPHGFTSSFNFPRAMGLLPRSSLWWN